MNRSALAVIILAAACARKSQSADTATARLDTAASAVAAAPAPSETTSAPDTAAHRKTVSPTASGSRSGATSGASTGPSEMTGDTLRGRVAVTGTEREKHVIIRPADGSRAVELNGAQAATVGHAAGADVVVRGTRESNGRFTVASFVVRTVDGVAATDGVLALDDQLVLVTPDGARHIVAHAPPALRAHIGARVWISGDLSRSPQAWGVISENR